MATRTPFLGGADKGLVGRVFRGLGRRCQYRAGTVPGGGVFLPAWLSKHINQKEMYALYHLLRQFFTRYPDALRRAQVLIGVDNTAVVGVFNRGRAKGRDAHTLLVQLFDLQVGYKFLLSLQWIPTEAKGVADSISRPSRESISRLSVVVFRALWEELGPFNMDLMAC